VCGYVLLSTLNVSVSLSLSFAGWLDSRWVQHHSDTATHGLGRQVLPERGSHGTTVAVWSGDLAPYDPQVAGLGVTGASRLSLGTVHIAATLTQVEVRLILQLDTFYSEQSCVLMLITQTSLEPCEYCLHVQSARLPCLGLCYSLGRCFTHLVEWLICSA